MSQPTPPQTLVQMFDQRIHESGDRTAIRFRVGEEIQSKSWTELARDVYRATAGLTTLGVQPGDRVLQVSENRYEWIVVDLAVLMCQAIHVPVHAPLAAEQVLYQLEHSGAKAAIVSGAEQWNKLLSVADSLPSHVRYVVFEEDAPLIKEQRPILFKHWLDAETEFIGKTSVARALEHVKPDDLASILYTSGTTGQPKGVMLSHDNLLSNAAATVRAFGMKDTDVRLNFLPLSHIFARTCDLYTWIENGSMLCLATSRDTVLPDCQWSEPTLISGVPYFFDRVRRYLAEQGRDQQPGALRAVFGGKLRFCCSGGAALPDHVFDYYEQQSLPILQGYGLSETSPVISVSSPELYRRGASGVALDNVEVKIADDGEIVTRGPHVMHGYWKDEEATSEIIKDGWLHTGDLGKVDEDGYVWITGRKKELIVTSAGKNVAPVLLESLLTEDDLIEQALVIGDGRSFLTALIVPNWSAVQSQLPQVVAPISDPEARSHPDVEVLFTKQIAERLSSVSYHEQVRKFTLLERPFMIEKHEMTPKLSLRRPIIHEHFAEEIEAMYRK